MAVPATRVEPPAPAAGSRPVPQDGTSRRRRVGPGLLALLLALGVYAAANARPDIRTTGDEPHYLLLAHSLAFDGDVDLRDEYADPDVVHRYYLKPRIDTHAYEYRPDGRWISIHSVGLSALLTPVVALGGGVGEARAVLLVASALLAAQLLGLLRDLRVASAAWTWVAWGLVAFSLPLLNMAGQLYPDVPGALLALTALRLLLRPPTRWTLTAAVVAAAALPWLHVRYAVLAAGLGAATAVRALWPAAGRSPWRRLAEARPARLVVLVPLALSAVVLLVAYARWYGAPSPSAAYEPRDDIPFYAQAPVEYGTESFYRYSLGAFLSPSFGWLPFAPAHGLGLLGAVLLVRRWPATAGAVLATVAVYVVALGGLDPGVNLQARFLVPVLPLVAVPLAALLGRGRAWGVAVLGAGALTAAIAVAAVSGSWWHLHADLSGVTSVGLAEDLQGLWPTISSGPPAGYPDWKRSAVIVATAGVLAAVLAARGTRHSRRPPEPA